MAQFEGTEAAFRPTLRIMAKRHLIRRQQCPKCHKGFLVVTYEQEIDGSGNVTLEAPIRAAGCRTDGCQNQWLNGRIRRGYAEEGSVPLINPSFTARSDG